jgi:sorting nexin-4
MSIPRRSVDLYHQAMYESIRVHVPRQPSEHSSAASSTSATPQSSPTLSTSLVYSRPTDATKEPGFDLIDDLDDFQLESRFIELDPRAVLLPRNMAADFSEGRLETFVGKPQKELPGTKDAYVSYLVTTKVGTGSLALLALPSVPPSCSGS